VTFDKLDAGEKTLFSGTTKEEVAPQFDELQNELQELQKRLYAQNKHRILVVMQAMDTGGKDGCIKHVFSRIDPQGIHVRSFKKPTVEELASEYAGKVKVAKLNIDDNAGTPPKYGIRGIPTLMLFKNGNMEAFKVGAMSKSQLTAFLDSNI